MILRSYILLSFIFILCKSSPNSNAGGLFNEIDTCKCGIQNNLAPRIVGGKEDNFQFYPWLVAIFYSGMVVCGGSLINDRYILTAGHCITGKKKENFSIIFDLQDRIRMEKRREGGNIAEVEDIILHENFSDNGLHDNHDIGLIKLKNPVDFSDENQRTPICIYNSKGNDSCLEEAKILGWGRMGETKQAAQKLRSAKLMIMQNDKCKEAKEIGPYIQDSMLCAYGPEVDACQGDSGGPLIVEASSGHLIQLGVVSWGIGCATPDIPGVYTRTSWYLDWIAAHTHDAKYCTNDADAC